MSKYLDDLKLLVEQAGYTEGTPPFEALLRRKQVEACQDQKGVASCDTCSAEPFCELLKAHLRDMHFGVPKE